MSGVLRRLLLADQTGTWSGIDSGLERTCGRLLRREMDQRVIEEKRQSCSRSPSRIIIIFLRWYWMIGADVTALWIIYCYYFRDFFFFFLSFTLSSSALTVCFDYCKLTPEQLIVQINGSDQDSDPPHGSDPGPVRV